jgi:hypothetical protein
MNLFKRFRPHHDAIRDSSESRRVAFESLDASQVQNNIGIGAKNSILDNQLVRIRAENETLIGNGKNSFIIIGKDREHIRNSGGSAISGTYHLANSIDLCVGLGYNPDPEVQRNKHVDSVGINPDFIHDKARVYITEGLNVDAAFGISKYGTYITDESHILSSVITKADSIRVLGRTGIKMIAGSILDTDNPQSSVPEDGIELIHTGGGRMQPMVLGNNLVNTLNDIISHINKLNVRLTSHIIQQIVWDTKISNHMHLNVFPNTPDPALFSGIIDKLVKDIDVITKSEIDRQINTAVTKASMKSISSDSILSSYHKLN